MDSFFTYVNATFLLGYLSSKMVYNRDYNKWEIISTRTGSILAEIMGNGTIPIGLQRWKFLDDKCKDENGTLLNLHLDVPQPGHFCCNDGECINSNFVGDDVTHCEGD